VVAEGGDEAWEGSAMRTRREEELEELCCDWGEKGVNGGVGPAAEGGGVVVDVVVVVAVVVEVVAELDWRGGE
jgi:hypothetical protein